MSRFGALVQRAKPTTLLGLGVLALLAVSACADDPAPMADPDRLLARSSGMTMDGVVRMAEHGLPMWVDVPPVGEAFQMPQRVRQLAMHVGEDTTTRDSRLALLAPSGSRYRFEVDIPTDARLQTAFGYLLSKANIGRQLTARIQAWDLGPMRSEPAGSETGQVDTGGASSSHSASANAEEPSSDGVIVYEESFAARGADGWRELDLDLGAFAGRRILLELAFDDPAFGSRSEDSPRLVENPGIPIVWGAWASPEVWEIGQQEGYDLLLISLDTLRADRLGCYGHDRPTSPNLDRLAASGVRFETAVSQAPWTRPSHRALFTGLYPASTGGLHAPPIARVLWQNGWRTGALTGGGQVDASFGFHDGFETYRVQYWLQQLEEVKSWYEEGRGRRNFLFLHTFEIHDPYTDFRFTEGMDPGRIEDRFETAMWVDWQYQLSDEEKAFIGALYDGGIAYTDERLGELFDWLRETGRLDRMVVVITSDHGEQFFEHGGWRHGSTLFDHELLVPLIVHLPPALEARLRAAGGGGEAHDPWVIRDQVRLVDLYPTLLELLDVPMEASVQGRSLVPLLEGRSLEPVPAFSENVNIDIYERKSLRTERWKLVWQIPKGATAHLREESVHLFDLGRDPLEQIDIAGDHPKAIERLHARIRQIADGQVGSLDEEVPEGLDPELVEKLRSLGYLQ